MRPIIRLSTKPPFRAQIFEGREVEVIAWSVSSQGVELTFADGTKQRFDDVECGPISDAHRR